MDMRQGGEPVNREDPWNLAPRRRLVLIGLFPSIKYPSTTKFEERTNLARFKITHQGMNQILMILV
jgi:hypothetical protein